MGEFENLIAYDNIKLVSPYEIQQLSELKIVKKMNDHVYIYFTGIVPEEKKDSYVEKATANDKIEVAQMADGSKVRTLFKGLVSNVGIRFVKGVYYIDVEGLSHTCEMDVKLKSRSFQDKNMLYKDIIEKVIKDYSGADFKDCASKGSKLDKFIVQYTETDWQFIKRMASHFNTVLVPNVDADGPKFWFGLPGEKDGKLPEDFHYTSRKDVARYMNLSQNDVDGLEDRDFTYCEAESGNFLDLGWKVKFKEKSMIVVEATAIIKGSTLKYEYVLAPEQSMKQARMDNILVTGAEIEGKILEVKDDTVKVHLEIDKEQNKAEAYWFKYATTYTTEGNSGWYCMPEVGDSVKLYVPTKRDESAFVVNSVRKDGKTCPKTADPEIKYLETNHGKYMKLGKKDLVFTAKEGQMVITLDEDKGVEIKSDKLISVKAEKDITIDVDKNIKMTAGETIYVCCNGSSIIMNGDTNIKGSLVKVDGTIKTPVTG